MNKTWFTCEATGDTTAEVHIYEEIGAWGITAKDFNEALRAVGPVTHLDLYINSPGGSVFDGIGIFNMLKRHKATITVHIDGIAASIASFIAMVGDTIIMPSNSMMMIHDPSGYVVGTSKDMRDIATALDKMKTSMVNAYVAKSGLPEEEVRQLMSDETWLTAQEAVDQGFADELADEVQMAALFDLSKYRNTPDALGEDFTNRGNPPPNKEVAMTTTPKAKAETPAEMEARLRAEITAQLKAEADDEGKAPPFKKKDEEEDGDAEARIRAEVAEVVAMCELAGYANKATEYIAKGLKPAAVLTELQKLKADGQQQTQTTTASGVRTVPPQQQQNNGQSGLPDKVTAELDVGAIWSKWNGKAKRAA